MKSLSARGIAMSRSALAENGQRKLAVSHRREVLRTAILEDFQIVVSGRSQILMPPYSVQP